jgi:hypothetical protein
VTSAQVTATGTALLFALCAVLLAWLGSTMGVLFAAGCTATIGGMALQRS